MFIWVLVGIFCLSFFLSLFSLWKDLGKNIKTKQVTEELSKGRVIFHAPSPSDVQTHVEPSSHETVHTQESFSEVSPMPSIASQEHVVSTEHASPQIIPEIMQDTSTTDIHQGNSAISEMTQTAPSEPVPSVIIPESKPTVSSAMPTPFTTAAPEVQHEPEIAIPQIETHAEIPPMTHEMHATNIDEIEKPETTDAIEESQHATRG